MTAAELLKDLKDKIEQGLVDPNKQVYVELYKGYTMYRRCSKCIPDPKDKTYNLAIGVFNAKEQELSKYS